ncbi:MAG: tetratricopeptide repeat protein [Rubrivivax sp.]
MLLADDRYARRARCTFWCRTAAARTLAVSEAAAQHAGDDAPAWFNHGFMLEEAGRYEQALEAFGRATTLDPKLDRAWYGMALVLIRLRRFGEAVPALERNLALQLVRPAIRLVPARPRPRRPPRASGRARSSATSRASSRKWRHSSNARPVWWPASRRAERGKAVAMGLRTDPSQRLVALFGLGALLLTYPLLGLFNLPATVGGIPLLYAYLFGAWGALIALLALTARRAPEATGRRPAP